MSIKRLTLPDEIKNRVAIKNIKLGIGHDLMGMYCDIWLDKKNIGYFNDDGWGGEPDISLTEVNKNKLLELLQQHDWRNRMFNDLGWNFYDTADKISDDSVIQSLVEHLTDEKQKEKVLKKISKLSEHNIIWGTWERYSYSGFKGKLPINQMVKVYGLQKMQEYIDNQVKPKLNEGEHILNTNFEELGLIK